MRAALLRNWWPPAVWAALILYLSGDVASSGRTEAWVQTFFGEIGPDAAFSINYSVRKSAHVVAYGILGALNQRASRNPLAALLMALAVAVADETHQSASSVRTGSLADIGLDACGAALGVMAVRRRLHEE